MLQQNCRPVRSQDVDQTGANSHAPLADFYGSSVVGDTQKLRRNILDRLSTREKHRKAQLISYVFKNALYAERSAKGQPVDHRTPHRYGLRTQRKCTEHINAPTDAAVEDDRDSSIDYIDHLTQNADGRRCSIDLPSTMIGYLNRGGACPNGDICILRTQNAFDDDGQPGHRMNEANVIWREINFLISEISFAAVTWVMVTESKVRWERSAQADKLFTRPWA